MKLLDTDVFIYARGRDHAYRDACLRILEQAVQDPRLFGIDVETLQELMDVYARRDDRARASEAVRDALAVFPNPFPVMRPDVEEAAELLAGNRRLSPRDAIHAAVCLRQGLEGIVSADRAFDRVPGLARFDPIKLA